MQESGWVTVMLEFAPVLYIVIMIILEKEKNKYVLVY